MNERTKNSYRIRTTALAAGILLVLGGDPAPAAVLHVHSSGDQDSFTVGGGAGSDGDQVAFELGGAPQAPGLPINELMGYKERFLDSIPMWMDQLRQARAYGREQIDRFPAQVFDAARLWNHNLSLTSAYLFDQAGTGLGLGADLISAGADLARKGIDKAEGAALAGIDRAGALSARGEGVLADAQERADRMLDRTEALGERLRDRLEVLPERGRAIAGRVADRAWRVVDRGHSLASGVVGQGLDQARYAVETGKAVAGHGIETARDEAGFVIDTGRGIAHHGIETAREQAGFAVDSGRAVVGHLAAQAEPLIGTAGLVAEEAGNIAETKTRYARALAESSYGYAEGRAQTAIDTAETLSGMVDDEAARLGGAVQGYVGASPEVAELAADAAVEASRIGADQGVTLLQAVETLRASLFSMVPGLLDQARSAPETIYGLLQLALQDPAVYAGQALPGSDDVAAKFARLASEPQAMIMLLESVAGDPQAAATALAPQAATATEVLGALAGALDTLGGMPAPVPDRLAELAGPLTQLAADPQTGLPDPVSSPLAQALQGSQAQLPSRLVDLLKVEMIEPGQLPVLGPISVPQGDLAQALIQLPLPGQAPQAPVTGGLLDGLLGGVLGGL